MSAESIDDDKNLGKVSLENESASLTVELLGKEERIEFDPRLEWKNQF